VSSHLTRAELTARVMAIGIEARFWPGCREV
jgi:hypothetical protein